MKRVAMLLVFQFIILMACGVGMGEDQGEPWDSSTQEGAAPHAFVVPSTDPDAGTEDGGADGGCTEPALPPLPPDTTLAPIDLREWDWTGQRFIPMNARSAYAIVVDYPGNPDFFYAIGFDPARNTMLFHVKGAKALYQDRFDLAWMIQSREFRTGVRTRRSMFLGEEGETDGGSDGGSEGESDGGSEGESDGGEDEGGDTGIAGFDPPQETGGPKIHDLKIYGWRYATRTHVIALQYKSHHIPGPSGP